MIWIRSNILLNSGEIILCQLHLSQLNKHKLFIGLLKIWSSDKLQQHAVEDSSVPAIPLSTFLGTSNTVIHMTQNTLTASFQRGKTSSMILLDMTQSNPMMRLQ